MISNAFPKPPKGSFSGSLALVVEGSKVVRVGVGSGAVVDGGGDGVTYESLVVEAERVVVVDVVGLRVGDGVGVDGSSVCVCVGRGLLVSVVGGVSGGSARVGLSISAPPPSPPAFGQSVSTPSPRKNNPMSEPENARVPTHAILSERDRVSRPSTHSGEQEPLFVKSPAVQPLISEV